MSFPEQMTYAMTYRWIVQATGAEPHGPYDSESDDRVLRIETDSRKIQLEDLFLAIVGESLDGHKYIPQSIQQGATAILCEKKRYESEWSARFPKVTFFCVDSTVDAFRALAKSWRQKFQIPVVAVAGSVGKTTTKELLSAILSGKFNPCLKTQGSQNGFLGIPMTLLELRPHHQAAVIEIGIDEIGAMDQHLEVVDPSLGILTRLGPEHLEKLIDVPTVVREETALFRFLVNRDRPIVWNLDDPELSQVDSLFSGSVSAENRLNFGMAAPANSVAGTFVSGTPDLLKVRFPNSVSATFQVPLPGAHNAANLLGALAVAYQLGLSPDEMKDGLGRFLGASGRSETATLPGNIQVLCDFYNSNPTSLHAAIETVATLPKTSTAKKWWILGDMLELGQGEERFHRAIADWIDEHNPAGVFLFGPRMKWLEQEMLARKSKNSVSHFEDKAILAKSVSGKLSAGDCLLIKGSRGMRLEEVWEIIRSSRAL